jgi:hypothetical protein
MKQATRNTRPQLSESWGDFDDELSDGSSGESVDDEQDFESPSLEAIEEHGNPRSDNDITPSKTALRRTNGRATRQSVESDSRSPATRRSTRLGSRNGSVEPELIMPSMHQSMESSFAQKSPNARARRNNKLPRSETTQRRGSQPLTRHDQYLIKSSTRKDEANSSPLLLIWANVVAPTMGYIFGVLKIVLQHMKPLFGALIALCLFLLLVQFAFRQVLSLGPLGSIPTIFGYMASPCSIPGASYLPLCGTRETRVTAPVEFDQLMTVQSAFEDVVQSAAEGSTLPMAMKYSESSVRDLKHVVMYSNLPSKSSLVFEFEGFIEMARMASADLTKFNSRIGRAVDHIISANRFTLQVIDGFAESDAQRGTVSRFLSASFPFFGPGGLTEAHLLEQYLRQTSEVETQIHGLIADAEALMKIMDDLDGRLDVIHDIITRDGVHVKGSRDELFAQLWTKLGGNRSSVQKVENQMALLRQVGTSRQTAWNFLQATLIRLQEIAAGLEDLRERVAAPEVVGTDIPLQQHIQVIQMGVERLEIQRDNSRTLQMESYRKIMDRGTSMGNDRQVDASKGTKGLGK